MLVIQIPTKVLKVTRFVFVVWEIEVDIDPWNVALSRIDVTTATKGFEACKKYEYSNHLNTGRVWCSNVSGCQMVWYFNGGLETGLEMPVNVDLTILLWPYRRSQS